MSEPDFITDVVMNMCHDIDDDMVTFHRSEAWPGNALNELNHLYRKALESHLSQERQRRERVVEAWGKIQRTIPDSPGAASASGKDWLELVDALDALGGEGEQRAGG